MRTPTPQDGRLAGKAGAARSTRRAVVRTVFGAAVVAGTAGTLAPILAKKASAGPAGAAAPPAVRVTETYRGRHIECLTPGAAALRQHGAGRAPGGRAHTPGRPEVLIDGRPLHVMRCANGGYMTVVNHYESFPTLLAAARAAVDDLGSAQLSWTSAHTT
ncbi:tyrosinase family oxidase copper chaperone (plasmid) [Streptomyces sp. CA-294286]|uniref:tyrosinase family oxidase copper chaperone n=1 Tax=Streptomyces sp. CA-294286 TaxID=3240070 RepID=UPI003D91A6D3